MLANGEPPLAPLRCSVFQHIGDTFTLLPTRAKTGKRCIPEGLTTMTRSESLATRLLWLPSSQVARLGGLKFVVLYANGAPGEIRTHDLCLRRTQRSPQSSVFMGFFVSHCCENLQKSPQ